MMMGGMMGNDAIMMLMNDSYENKRIWYIWEYDMMMDNDDEDRSALTN